MVLRELSVPSVPRSPCSTSFHHQVGLLYEEGVRKAQSSDSSKRTFSVYSSSRQQGRYAPSYTPRSGWAGTSLRQTKGRVCEVGSDFSPLHLPVLRWTQTS